MYQNFIIPYLYEAWHVSGDTPPIIRNLKLHWQPLVFHTLKVVGRVVGGRQAHCAWQHPPTTRPTTFHICWPLVPKIAGSNLAETVGFFGQKNPQHAFLRRGSKAVCPMSQICGMLKTPGNYVEVGFSGKICRPFLACFRSLLSEGSHVAWCRAPLGSTVGTKGGAQRAC